MSRVCALKKLHSDCIKSGKITICPKPSEIECAANFKNPKEVYDAVASSVEAKKLDTKEILKGLIEREFPSPQKTGRELPEGNAAKRLRLLTSIERILAPIMEGGINKSKIKYHKTKKSKGKKRKTRRRVR